jgi:hypothetical protein
VQGPVAEALIGQAAVIRGAREAPFFVLTLDVGVLVFRAEFNPEERSITHAELAHSPALNLSPRRTPALARDQADHLAE